MLIEKKLAAVGEFIHAELASPPPAVADGDEAVSPPEEPAFDWGVNGTGWNVVIHNQSALPITPWYMGPDMVGKAPRMIEPQATVSIVGKVDPLCAGAPADMTIDLRMEGFSNVLSIRRAHQHGGFTAEVYGCDPWSFSFDALDARQPLVLRVLVGRSPQARAA